MPTDPQDQQEPVAHRPAEDAGVFEAIVLAHQQQIARLVFRLLGRADEVEDVVQEVFLSALEHLKRFRRQSKVATWLTAIAINKCRSHRRRRLLRLRSLFRHAETLSGGACVEGAGSESAEVHQHVLRAVHKLPARYREPIVLRYFEGLTAAEIADILRISVSNVEARLSRARRKLKTTLSHWAEEQ